MQSQVVVLLSVRGRDFHLSHFMLDAVELVPKGSIATGGQLLAQDEVHGVEIAIPAIDLRPNPPLIDGGGYLDQREEDGNQGNQHDLQPIDEGGRPEWQVADQEGRAGLVVAARFIAQGNVHAIRRGKLSGQLEETGRAVDGARRDQQQITQGGMEVGPDHEVDRRRHQHRVLGG